MTFLSLRTEKEVQHKAKDDDERNNPGRTERGTMAPIGRIAI